MLHQRYIMLSQRYKELEDKGGSLSSEEMQAGWHYCPEWDYMLTNYNDKDAEPCSCTPWDFVMERETNEAT